MSMLANLVNKIKKLIYRLLIFWKSFYQNINLKKIISKEDIIYLNNDQIQEAENYWNNYTKKYNINFIKYYSSRTHIFNKFYIPDNIYYSYIDMHFNNSKMSYGIDNKALYDKLLPNLKKPFTILRKMNGYYYDNNYKLINFADTKELFDHKDYILKPSIDSHGGAGIIFFKINECKDLKELFSYNENFVVQEVVTQHETLKKLYPNSLNTIRVISLFLEGEVHILSSVLRIGIAGSKIDNASAGGIVVGIDQAGYLKKYAYSSKIKSRFESHPDTKISFEGYQIPSFEEIISIVKREAINFPYFQLISWDFAINEDGEVVFIEFNLKNGQLDFHQLTNGPLFGELTDKILEEVFMNRGLKKYLQKTI